MIPYWDDISTKPVEYSPYRVVEVSASMKLSEFAKVVFASFEFSNLMPFGFYYNKISNYLFAKEGYVMRFEDEDDWNTFDPNGIYGDVEKATISDILTRRNKKWLLLFDYIREWHIHIWLLDKSEGDDSKSYPRVIEEHMKAPSQYDNYHY